MIVVLVFFFRCNMLSHRSNRPFATAGQCSIAISQQLGFWEACRNDGHSSRKCTQKLGNYKVERLAEGCYDEFSSRVVKGDNSTSSQVFVEYFGI